MPCVEPNEIKMKIEVIILMIGTLFQTTRSTTFLSRDQWITVYDRVRELLRLSQTPEFMAQLILAHSTSIKEEVDEKELTADEIIEKMANQNLFETERSVFPSLSTFLERMDENLWKSYQKLAPSSIDYLLRINDENKLLFLIDETMAFLSKFDLDVFRARIALIKLTYLYYKNDSIYTKIESRILQKGGQGSNE
jgi:hypothetical protein